MIFNPTIIPATLADYPIVQNMARFYAYDLSRDCSFISSDWAMPENGCYESFDFKIYFEDKSCKAYLIKIDGELAGFALLNQATTTPQTNWNVGEFCILAKFQGKGIGRQVIEKILNANPGIWEVAVIPENKSALGFWERTINRYTNGNYKRELKTVRFDQDQPQHIIFTFDTKAKNVTKTKGNT